MKTIRSVSIVDKPERREALSSLGVKFVASEPPVSPILWLDIYESDPAWEQLRKLIPKWSAEDGDDPNYLGNVGTIFSEKDRDAAPFLELGAWAHGYPMPDLDFGYLEATYDLSDYCEKCGIGARQVAPFRMKREPKWGKKHIMSLEWVYDELFVPPEVWEHTFRPFGIGCRPVLHHRSGNQLETVVQLDITATAASALKMPADQATEFCATCGRTKYQPIQRGPFPGFDTEPTDAMLKTQEWFGSGAEARHPVVVSASVFRTMREHQIKGAVFTPCASSGDPVTTV